MTLTLYDYVLSGSAYKARLMMAILGVPYEAIPVDFYPGNEHRQPDFLDLNPSGTLPVLVDGDLVLTDSAAILAYIAQNHDPSGKWMPVGDAAQLAQVIQWLAFSQRLTATAGAARLHDMINRPLDVEAARKGAHAAFRELERHLTDREFYGATFLVGDCPTIADIACFPYVALSPDGGIAHDDYPAIRRWLYAVRALPGFLEMPGIHALHDLRDDRPGTVTHAAE